MLSTDLTPKLAMSRVSSAMPPGLSETVTTQRHNRPSVAKPLSIQRPRTVVSILPPHKGITTLKTNKEKTSLMYPQINDANRLKMY